MFGYFLGTLKGDTQESHPHESIIKFSEIYFCAPPAFLPYFFMMARVRCYSSWWQVSVINLAFAICLLLACQMT